MNKEKNSNNPFDVLSNLRFSESDIEEVENIEIGNDQTNDLKNLRKSQKIRIWLEKKKRKGKPVSLITGFNEYQEDMKSLAKLMKVKLGVGGSFTDDEILIQSQNRDKILEILISEGFKDVKKAGG